MNRFGRIGLFAGLALLAALPAAGREGPSCDVWEPEGFRDGMRGVPDAFEARARACAGIGLGRVGASRADQRREAYLTGHAAGLRLYCTVEGAFAAGRRGEAYQGVCPPEDEAAFVAAHTRGLAAAADEAGLSGYWRGAEFVAFGRGEGRPTPPRPVEWRDRDASRDSELSRLGVRSGTHDWRDLWDRKPREESPPPHDIFADVPPRPAPPRPGYVFDDDGSSHHHPYIGRIHQKRFKPFKPRHGRKPPEAPPPAVRADVWPHRSERAGARFGR